MSRSHGLYTLRNRPGVPPLNFIDPTLRYREPKTPDPASSDDDFDSTMPEDDKLPLPLPSSLPHPVTVYFCRIGRVMKDLGFIGYRSRIWKATDAHPAHQYTRFTCWFNRVSERWESLPKAYTTDPPPASNRLGEVEEWWEEAKRIARRRAKRLAAGNVGCSEGDEAESGDDAESGNGAESGDGAESSVGAERGNRDEAEPGNEAKPEREADPGHEAEGHIIHAKQRPQVQCIPDDEPDVEGNLQTEDQGHSYIIESSLTPSDYSQSRKAEKLRLQHAQKNRGIGHDEMDTEEEEADDEMIMKEVDELDGRRRIKGKKSLKNLSPQGDGSKGTSSHVRCRLVKGKRPAQTPSADDNKTPDEGEAFTQTLRRLVKSKPPSQTPSGDSDGSGVEGASQSPHVRPVASTKALGKKRSNPVPKVKRGPYSACEMDQVKELADTIVEYCKNMGRTPESVLRKGGFNISLSREPSWWDVWQMYLRQQSYNPQQSTSFIFCPRYQASLNSFSCQSRLVVHPGFGDVQDPHGEPFRGRAGGLSAEYACRVGRG